MKTYVARTIRLARMSAGFPFLIIGVGVIALSALLMGRKQIEEAFPD